jgi:hypothetical protein
VAARRPTAGNRVGRTVIARFHPDAPVVDDGGTTTTHRLQHPGARRDTRLATIRRVAQPSRRTFGRTSTTAAIVVGILIGGIDTSTRPGRHREVVLATDAT